MEVDAHVVELAVMGLCVPGIGYMVKRIMKHSEDFIKEIATDVKVAVTTINQQGTEIQLLRQELTATSMRGLDTAAKTKEQDATIQQMQVTIATLQQAASRRRK